MNKKRIASLLALLMIISIFITPAYGQNFSNNPKIENKILESDRYKDKDKESKEYGFEKRLEKHPFNAAKYKGKKDNKSVENPEYTGIEVSSHLTSMTEIRIIDVTVELNHFPNIEGLEELEWTFGDKEFNEWKKWSGAYNTPEYNGEPFITFEEEPFIEDQTIKARIKFDLVYGTTNLSSRGVRRLYPDLIGVYGLKVKCDDVEVETPIKLNVYDSYRTYDELKPALDEIFINAKEDRYLDYEVIGKSTEGRDFHFVVLAKDKASVNIYLNEMVPMMLENPAELQEMIENDAIDNYKVPIFVNNIHPDEAPGIDAQLDALNMLATNDVINYETIDSNGDEITIELDVQELLEHVIFVMNLTENPDGRYYNTRQNINGFDVNRDNGYQTQIESRVVVEQIAKWNPISFLDLHGFVRGFLIEPCTPPHDPNYEYDLLIEGMLEQAHAMGRAGISNTKYDSYLIPLEDWGDGWDDGTPAYTATYAMHHGAMGHTIEMPELNQNSNNALVYTILESGRFVMNNKDRLFKNQLEYFNRGIEGIDDRDVDEWLTNQAGDEVGRPRGENDNFFPEYYVLPVDSSLQKNSLEVYNTVEYLLRNGVKVEKTTEEVTVNDMVYPTGTFIVNMHQAKRGYANNVLYEGLNASDFNAMYAEIVMSFPVLRGFDCYEIRIPDTFKGKTEKVSKVNVPKTHIDKSKDNKIESSNKGNGNTETYVIRNTNNDAIRAVNKLLSEGITVKMTLTSGNGYEKGDYIINKDSIKMLKKGYLLDIVSYDDMAEVKELVQPKVAATGSSHSIFVLKELGFNIVDVEDSNVIVDDYGYVDKDEILDGRDYVGIGQWALDFIEVEELLTDFDYESTASYWGDHEGLVKGNIATDSFITTGYEEDNYLYTVNGAWITQVPEDAEILATISNEDDFFISGWWPNHDQAKGQVMAITQDLDKNIDITVFANAITNKAHPQYYYRMLANAIFTSISDID